MRMMLDVARHGGTSHPVSLATVAQRTDLSRGYLEQVALALRNARLLRGVSGRQGGYRLANPASEISIGQVIEALIGPVCLVDCLEDPSACSRSSVCECRVMYGLINNQIADILRSYTLADLLDPDWVRNHGGGVHSSLSGAASSDAGGCNPTARLQTRRSPAQGLSRVDPTGGSRHRGTKNRGQDLSARTR
jgi:Rrf2 family protein